MNCPNCQSAMVFNGKDRYGMPRLWCNKGCGETVNHKHSRVGFKLRADKFDRCLSLMAQGCGIRRIMVLTGVAKQTVQRIRNAFYPDHARWHGISPMNAAQLEKNAARRARLRNAMPKWADRKAIRAVYQQAVELSVSTGIPHHVDHIIPLASNGICGLHVEWNLQVLPAIENQKKGNRLTANESETHRPVQTRLAVN